MPAISVIVPVHNSETTIKKCLESIIKQSFNDTEIICINNGSTDASLDILNEYASADMRIKVINIEEGNVSVARNLGLENASGEFICFADSDDFIDEHTYKYAYEAIVGNDVDLVRFPVNIINLNIDDDEYVRNMINHFKADRYGIHTITDNFIMNGPLTVVNHLFKKCIIDKYNIRFTDNIKFEDTTFFIQYACASKKCMLTDKGMYHYILYKNSTMGKMYAGNSDKINTEQNLKIIKDKFKIIDIIYNYFIEYKFINKHNDLICMLFSTFLIELNNSMPIILQQKILHEASATASKMDIKYFNCDTMKHLISKKYNKLDCLEIYTPLEHIFSFKRFRKHYILKFLGIKLKIKACDCTNQKGGGN